MLNIFFLFLFIRYPWVTKPALLYLMHTTCWLHGRHACLWQPDDFWGHLYLQPLTSSVTPDHSVPPPHTEMKWSSTRPGLPWPRSSWKGKTQRIWSGGPRKASLLNLCTLRLTPPPSKMSCLESSRSPEGLTPPCTPTDPGPSGNMLDSAL